VWEHQTFKHHHPDDLLKRFGWDKNTTPAQLQAVIALADWHRKTYLVDRHDEIAAGFGELAERLCQALETLDSTVSMLIK